MPNPRAGAIHGPQQCEQRLRNGHVSAWVQRLPTGAQGVPVWVLMYDGGGPDDRPGPVANIAHCPFCGRWLDA